MARVLLTWELGAGLGHCVKLAPLAEHLTARGHEVYFAARDVTTAQKALQNSAVKYLQSPCLMVKPANLLRLPRTFAQVLDQVGFGDLDRLRSLVDAWRSLLELVRPSVMVCEHSPSALLASRWIDTDRVIIGTGFSLPPDVSPLPDLCPWMGPPEINLLQHENQIVERANCLLTADGLAPLERLSQLYSNVNDALLMTFRELDHHPNRGAAEYLGSLNLHGGITPNWPEGDGPRAFAYLKSRSGPFRIETALAVLRELPAKILAYVPRASNSVLKLQSSSLRICTEPVNVCAALDGCDAAILNGTTGTATQCLLAGVPLLMVPTYLEQVVFSRRVVQLGAGLIVEPNRIELLAGRFWRVLKDGRFRSAAKAFADRYADYDSERRQNEMVNRVECLLSRQPASGNGFINDTLRSPVGISE